MDTLQSRRSNSYNDSPFPTIKWQIGWQGRRWRAQTAELASWFTNPTASDVTVKCNEETWKLHRILLTTGSDWLRANIPEFGPAVVTIDTEKTDAKKDDTYALYITLRFLYTGDLELIASGPRFFHLIFKIHRYARILGIRHLLFCIESFDLMTVAYDVFIPTGMESQTTTRRRRGGRRRLFDLPANYDLMTSKVWYDYGVGCWAEIEDAPEGVIRRLTSDFSSDEALKRAVWEDILYAIKGYLVGRQKGIFPPDNHGSDVLGSFRLLARWSADYMVGGRMMPRLVTDS